MRYSNRTKILLYTIVSLTILTWLFLFTKTNSNENERERRIQHDDEELSRKRVERIKFDVDCELILESNINEITKAERYLNTVDSYQLELIKDQNYIFSNEKCKQFRRLRAYDDYPVTTSELEFPLAFSILAYNDVEQLERLLRVIYRPHNVYCIHPDAKSPPEFHNAIKSIVQCFDNVFIASKLERIVYAGYSRLQADLNCMNDLLDAKYTLLDPTKKQVKWKYLFNLASTEFPLKTNYELVRILSIYNGANDIEVMKRYHKTRVSIKWISIDDKMVRTNVTKEEVPHGFTITKGLAYGVFTHSFVDYIINNKYSQDLAKYLYDTYSPDETYWATLQHNTQFNPPGGYKDDWSTVDRINTTSRFIVWQGDMFNCMGKWVRGVCIFSFRDLPLLITRHELFVNKFHLDYNPIVYQCMEEWIEKKVKARPTVRVKDYCKHPVVSFYNKNFYCD